MKTNPLSHSLLKPVLLLLGLLLVPTASLLHAQEPADSVDFQTFYDQLGGEGNWVQTDDYGYVFQPAVDDPSWSPYTVGHWVYNDGGGWTWVSDESFGWATYHYGRWANLDGPGWVWVPGYEWAPAWVSWRYGGGYAGWAPLPPETRAGIDVDRRGVGLGIHFGPDVDIGFNIGAGCYSFVPVREIGYRHVHERLLNRNSNYTVINRTTNITNITYYNNRGGNRAGGFNRVRAGGPPLAAINAQARQPIQNVQFSRSRAPGRAALQGRDLAVYAPQVDPATIQRSRPARVAAVYRQEARNRGDDIERPLAVRPGMAVTAPTAAQVAAARAAQRSAPAQARVAQAPAARSSELRPNRLTPGEPNQSRPIAPVRPVEAQTFPSTQAVAKTPETRQQGEVIRPRTEATQRAQDRAAVNRVPQPAANRTVQSPTETGRSGVDPTARARMTPPTSPSSSPAYRPNVNPTPSARIDRTTPGSGNPTSERIRPTTPRPTEARSSNPASSPRNFTPPPGASRPGNPTLGPQNRPARSPEGPRPAASASQNRNAPAAPRASAPPQTAPAAASNPGTAQKK